MKQEYILRTAFDGVIVTVGTREECLTVVGKTALDKNFGIYRKWKENGIEYYDTSAIVYTLEEVK